MNVWAVVPVKALHRAKRRLAFMLDARTRRRLVRAMCGDVLAALTDVRDLAGIAVVTSERDIVPPGMRVIDDQGGGLNAVLARALAILEGQGATHVLSIAADLPFATHREIEIVLAAGRTAPVVIVPDRAGRGTNALMLSPPTLLAPAFGRASLTRHAAMARALGVEPVVLPLAGLGFDVDDPEALNELRGVVAGRPEYRFLTPVLEAVR